MKMPALVLLLMPGLLAAADPAQTLAAELVRAQVAGDPARAATYQRIAVLLDAGRCSPADAVALLELAKQSRPVVADPAAVVAALDGEPAPGLAVVVPVVAPAATMAQPRVETAPTVPAPRPVVQSLSGGEGRTVAVAVESAGLLNGDRLRLERDGLTIGIAVVTRIQGGLALASVIPDTASGAIVAGDRARIER